MLPLLWRGLLFYPAGRDDSGQVLKGARSLTQNLRRTINVISGHS